ncbi:MAG: 50S ribosomal protein L20 [Clostridiales bacterium]|nr:50S ribosomal protein L20 [Clostridiales bacterium]MBQ5967235.1 50S ribosomal protein L20 [Clostridiales bacterium]MBQ6271283.1 50S ribosomal protein L20 [Clostridiales bacterium]MCR5059046.1 50S ribosomal protein L20 [Clostridiales bacterium]
MSRVKRGMRTRARHHKILKQAKGYFGHKSKLFKVANQQVMKSGIYAYRDRKAKKRDFRKLWIQRINAACRLNGMSYSRFMNGLKKANIALDRKVLSDIAISDPNGFAALCEQAKNAL